MYRMYSMCAVFGWEGHSHSVVDRHSFHADPDPTVYFDANRNPLLGPDFESEPLTGQVNNWQNLSNRNRTASTLIEYFKLF